MYLKKHEKYENMWENLRLNTAWDDDVDERYY